MNVNKRIFIWILVCLFFSGFTYAKNLAFYSPACRYYQIPTDNELKAAYGGFLSLLDLKQKPSASTVKTNVLTKLGFSLQLVEINSKPYVSVFEPEKDCTGKGFYLVNLVGKKPILLEAPHRFFDLKTADITFAMIRDDGFIAAAFGSAHRYCRYEGKVLNADVAHNKKSYMLTFTQAFLRNYPHGMIVQIHGFDKAKRYTDIAATADFVLSGGNHSISFEMENLSHCLKTKVSKATFLFPVHVHELGATTNTIGQWVNKRHKDQFIHVEISRDMRRKLAANKSVLKQFSECIMALR